MARKNIDGHQTLPQLELITSTVKINVWYLSFVLETTIKNTYQHYDDVK